ncbi:MAG: polymerase sigma factor, sigma-70 family [Solirubrobacterales bacterium]|jgi:RNA polymerase sigma-70 factor (ECF subfamily)|nr:polymerase sigma factor, sigma-70 family [Solirubrobacterales bacterium]
MDEREELLEELRPQAFAIAYRMVGTVTEAEDLVQESLLRLHTALERGERIDSPRAYVATVVTRLGIDELRSARHRRETYVGDWLPEPLLTGGTEDPEAHAEMADSLSMAFLLLLESLTPEQRAAFLLREVFDYPYDRVAEIIGTSEANARQLAARARGHVASGRGRFEASRERGEELADRFMAAVERGELADLEAMLAEDVVLRGDGGGKVPALARALHGARRVAKTLAAWGRVARRVDVNWERVEVNGQAGVLTRDPEGGVISVLALDVADGRIQGISSVVNPDKLRHVGPLGDPRRLLRAQAGDGR